MVHHHRLGRLSGTPSQARQAAAAAAQAKAAATVAEEKKITAAKRKAQEEAADEEARRIATEVQAKKVPSGGLELPLVRCPSSEMPILEDPRRPCDACRPPD